MQEAHANNLLHSVQLRCAEKQTYFAEACKDVTAVKLRNVKRSISFSDPAVFDILCNRSTSLEVIKLPFLPRVPPSSSKLNIDKVQGPRQSAGVVEAKILAQGTLSKVVPVNGTDCELK
ncbi:hypothetical protein ANANG_G00319430 [Anguilla anguilla]|uniref:Uncharacterized protein n=1 Tax=Anguilla anguilla TaxID=7936 RepID=A0A9D3RHE9_ANGAN|nr:hypothetical protein ANANG_G00319430 [Anguilla anguilla]